jgi:hypothetical protein
MASEKASDLNFRIQIGKDASINDSDEFRCLDSSESWMAIYGLRVRMRMHGLSAGATVFTHSNSSSPGSLGGNLHAPLELT